MSRRKRLSRALLAVLVLALLYVAAALVRSLASFWVVFWLLMLWAFSQSP